MANIVSYSENPFDEFGLKTVELELTSIKDAVSKLNYDVEIYDLVVGVNDQIIENWEDYEMKPGDIVSILLAPKGDIGNIFRSLAFIALAVVAPWAGVAIVGTAGITASLVAAGIMVAGAYLINAILPIQVPDRPNDFSTSSPTYSWSNESNQVMEGTALPKLFGKLKVTPFLIEQYVETSDNVDETTALSTTPPAGLDGFDLMVWYATRYGDQEASGGDQYLNMLYALNDGELSSISDIRINDNPIDYYEGVSYVYAPGTITQSVIPRFSATRFDQQVNYKLTSGHEYMYSNVQTNHATELGIGIYFPNGIYFTQDDGTRQWGSWTIYIMIDGINGSEGYHYETYFNIGANDTSELRKMLKFTVPEGEYKVSVKSWHDTFHPRYDVMQSCYWTHVQATIPFAVRYPGTALLAVRVKANEQLSGSTPKITCVIENAVNNPADCAIAILEECGIDSSRLDTDAFDDWRTECTTRGYKFNAYLDCTTTVKQVLDYLGTTGRAKVEQRGSKFTVIQDKPGILPTQGFMFGMGNILLDSYKEEFLPLTERANTIELTFLDEDNNYEKAIVEVSSEGYDSETESNKTSLMLIGITNRLQAMAYGYYRLAGNRYLTLTCSWEANVDALVCRVGDIVQVSHDVPQWGESGRIVSSTTTECVIDRPVELVTGTYYLRVKRNTDNTVQDVKISEVSEDGLTLTFDSEITDAFELHDIYSFGKVNTLSKLMRVTGIQTTGDDFKRTITAIEYNEGVYIYADDITDSLEDDYADFLYYGKKTKIEYFYPPNGATQGYSAWAYCYHEYLGEYWIGWEDQNEWPDPYPDPYDIHHTLIRMSKSGTVKGYIDVYLPNTSQAYKGPGGGNLVYNAHDKCMYLAEGTYFWQIDRFGNSTYFEGPPGIVYGNALYVRPSDGTMFYMSDNQKWYTLDSATLTWAFYTVCSTWPNIPGAEDWTKIGASTLGQIFGYDESGYPITDQSFTYYSLNFSSTLWYRPQNFHYAYTHAVVKLTPGVSTVAGIYGEIPTNDSTVEITQYGGLPLCVDTKRNAMWFQDTYEEDPPGSNVWPGNRISACYLDTGLWSEPVYTDYDWFSVSIRVDAVYDPIRDAIWNMTDDYEYLDGTHVFGVDAEEPGFIGWSNVLWCWGLEENKVLERYLLYCTSEGDICDPINNYPYIFTYGWDEHAANWVEPYYAYCSLIKITPGAQSSPVPTAPTIVNKPYLSGSCRVGEILTIIPGSVTCYPAPTSTTYQWYRNNGSGDVEIENATNKTYGLTIDDLGYQIHVRVVISNGISPDAAVYTAYSDIIQASVAVAIEFTSAPTITGDAYVGGVLTAVTGGYKGTPTSTTWAWKRNGLYHFDENGNPMLEMSSTYTCLSEDLGASITVTQTIHDSETTQSATSEGVTILAAP